MENYLIEHCAPTLASLKTANLFNYMYDSDAQLYAYIDELNQNLREKGVSVAVLRKYDHSALIYVYREKKLRADLAQKGVHTFLRYFGYEGFSADEAIAVLQARFGKEGEFPHEIGIFLGYPLGDVIGFIENAGRNSKCSGCWKVYCNECEAVRLFAKFDKCKEVYKRLFYQGKTIGQLTVAI